MYFKCKLCKDRKNPFRTSNKYEMRRHVMDVHHVGGKARQRKEGIFDKKEKSPISLSYEKIYEDDWRG